MGKKCVRDRAQDTVVLAHACVYNSINDLNEERTR